MEGRAVENGSYGACLIVAVRGGAWRWCGGLTRFPESLAGDAGAGACGGAVGCGLARFPESLAGDAGAVGWVDSIS